MQPQQISKIYYPTLGVLPLFYAFIVLVTQEDGVFKGTSGCVMPHCAWRAPSTQRLKLMCFNVMCNVLSYRMIGREI